MKKEVISGIYKITNKINNKPYIGSSNNIERRWRQHISLLNNNKHHSIKLQRAWNKYGQDNFEFEIIEECDVEKLLYLEQFYIDKYKAYFEGYNSKEKTIDDKYFNGVEIDKEEQPWLYYLNDFICRVKNIVFDDKKTSNRIRMNRLSEKEAMIYSYAIAFVCSTKYKEHDWYILFKNDGMYEKIENNKYKQINFEVILYDLEIDITFSINLSDMSIVMKDCHEYPLGRFLSFSERRSFINNNIDVFEYFVGYIFYPNKHKELYTGKYFEELLWNSFFNNKKLLEYKLGNVNGFIKEIYSYCYNNKIKLTFETFADKQFIKERYVNDADLKEVGVVL